MWKLTDADRLPALLASTVKQTSTDPKIVPALGLIKALNAWVKEQHQAEMDMYDSLAKDKQAFLDEDSRKYGCSLPPATQFAPNCNTFVFPSCELLDTTGTETISNCIEILGASYYPWSAQFTSTSGQHHTGIAISVLQLLQNKHIYTYYLGEQIVWAMYKKILAIVHQFSPLYTPWHGILTDMDRTDNDDQIILSETYKGEHIENVVGAGMASQASAIQKKYNIGLQKIWKTLVDMASHEHNGQEYLSSEVEMGTIGLFRVSPCIIH